MPPAATLPKTSPALTRAAELSRYVRDLLVADPELPARVPMEAPLERAWMCAQIDGQYDNDEAMKTALRRLRK
ncbi:MAG: hypothetical protein ABI619_07530, partial [Betaproteobacteria bacterium]